MSEKNDDLLDAIDSAPSGRNVDPAVLATQHYFASVDKIAIKLEDMSSTLDGLLLVRVLEQSDKLDLLFEDIVKVKGTIKTIAEGIVDEYAPEDTDSE